MERIKASVLGELRGNEGAFMALHWLALYCDNEYGNGLVFHHTYKPFGGKCLARVMGCSEELARVYIRTLKEKKIIGTKVVEGRKYLTISQRWLCNG